MNIILKCRSHLVEASTTTQKATKQHIVWCSLNCIKLRNFMKMQVRDEFIGLVRFDFNAILMDFCSNLVTNLSKNLSKLHQNRIAPNQWTRLCCLIWAISGEQNQILRKFVKASPRNRGQKAWFCSKLNKITLWIGKKQGVVR